MDIVPILTATLSAAASIIAAIVAGVFARRSRVAEAEAVRLRQLEERLSSKKIEMYEPLLEHLGDLLAQKSGAEHDSEKIVTDFMNLVVAYGSDDVLRVFTRFRTGSSASPPPRIVIRLAADLFGAIRRDLAGATTATGEELVGMRIRDLYSTDGQILKALTDPFPVVCEREGWTPPWGTPLQSTATGESARATRENQ